MNESELAERMQSCSILNDYDGLSELERLLESHPREAASIAWSVLRQCADPGRDDHGLCVNLTSICVTGFGRERFEELIVETWQGLSSEIRENIINGLANDGIGKTTVLALYNAAISGVVERHRIISVIASTRFDEFRDEFVEMISRLGSYEDPTRQSGLDRLVANIAAML
jgi:hypothetical protein